MLPSRALKGKSPENGRILEQDRGYQGELLVLRKRLAVLVGLSRGFLYAGTPSLLPTLWKVDDPATARLVEFFYRNWQQGMSKPEALRQAQLAMRKLPPYQHPYYWAPFVMIGDWK